MTTAECRVVCQAEWATKKLTSTLFQREGGINNINKATSYRGCFIIYTKLNTINRNADKEYDSSEIADHGKDRS